MYSAKPIRCHESYVSDCSSDYVIYSIGPVSWLPVTLSKTQSNEVLAYQLTALVSMRIRVQCIDARKF
jgi:hypothetical protein